MAHHRGDSRPPWWPFGVVLLVSVGMFIAGLTLAIAGAAPPAPAQTVTVYATVTPGVGVPPATPGVWDP